MTDKTCTWHRDADDDMYESDCGHSFYFVDSTLPEQTGFKWCPYCGLSIEASEPRACEDCGTDLANSNKGDCCDFCTKKRDEDKQ